MARRRPPWSALVTTAARLRPPPETTTSSTKATSSSGRRTAICMLIPRWYQNGSHCARAYARGRDAGGVAPNAVRQELAFQASIPAVLREQARRSGRNGGGKYGGDGARSGEDTSELPSPRHLVCRLL